MQPLTEAVFWKGRDRQARRLLAALGFAALGVAAGAAWQIAGSDFSASTAISRGGRWEIHGAIPPAGATMQGGIYSVTSGGMAQEPEGRSGIAADWQQYR